MAVNFGGSSEQVAARGRLMGPPPRGTVAGLAARLEVLEAEGLSDAELFAEIRKTLLAGKTTIGDDDNGITGRGNYSLLRPPREWYGGRKLGSAGLLLLLSEWRENERQYTPYASMAHHHVSPATPHGGVSGHAPSLVAPTVWNHRDPGGQGSGRWLMEPPRHKRWGLGAGIHLRDDLSIATVNQIVEGGIMVTGRTGSVLAPF